MPAILIHMEILTEGLTLNGGWLTGFAARADAVD
jgi:hypothetical protein